MNRRNFIKSSAIVGISAGLSSKISSCSSKPAILPYSGKRLIIIKLDGGNDGLYAFTQKGNDDIARYRPNLNKSSTAMGIAIANDWYLNQDLAGLMDLLEHGEIAFLPFVGYPQPNTSHFKSTDIWDSGYLPNDQIKLSGWLGRLLDEGKLTITGNETPLLSLAEVEPLLIKGEQKKGFSWNSKEPLHWYEPQIRHWLDHFQENHLTHQIIREYQLYQHLADIDEKPGFPATALGNQLAKICTIIEKDKPYKVFYAAQHGYDTHADAAARLSTLYRDLGASLKVLVSSLKANQHWNETMVFIYSEFGRTLKENANGGTDHGAASLCLLLGDNALVQKYRNVEPTIRFTEMAGDLYLDYQIDFRDLYQEMTELWL